MALGPLTEMSTRSVSWGKGGRCVRLTTLPPSCAVVKKSWNLNFLEPSGPLQACNGSSSPTYLPTYPPTHPHIHPSNNPSTHPSIYPHPAVYPCTFQYLSCTFHLPTYVYLTNKKIAQPAVTLNASCFIKPMWLTNLSLCHKKTLCLRKTDAVRSGRNRSNFLKESAVSVVRKHIHCMMTELPRFSETSVCQTTPRRIPEYSSPENVNARSLNSQMFCEYYDRQPLG